MLSSSDIVLVIAFPFGAFTVAVTDFKVSAFVIVTSTVALVSSEESHCSIANSGFPPLFLLYVNSYILKYL